MEDNITRMDGSRSREAGSGNSHAHSTGSSHSAQSTHSPHSGEHSSSGSSGSHSHGSGSAKRSRKRRTGLVRRFTDWCRNDPKNSIKLLGIVAAVAVIIVLLVLISRGDTGRSEESGENIPGEKQASLYYQDSWYRERTELETLLVLGIDKTSDQTHDEPEAYINHQQNDLNLLVVIDHSAKRYEILQLNRDTMTEIRKYGLNSQYVGTEVMQLALAHTYGTGGKDSCRNTVSAVENLLYDIHIDHYVSVTMDAVAVINDAVDGVTVKIEDDFGEGSGFVKGADVTLIGPKALEYVRARSSMQDDASNIARMRRQRTYMDALITAMNAKIKGSSTWAARTLRDVVDYTVSDLGYLDLGDLLTRISGYSHGDIQTTEGEARTVEGVPVEFYVDEDALQEQVIGLFYEKSGE